MPKPAHLHRRGRAPPREVSDQPLDLSDVPRGEVILESEVGGDGLPLGDGESEAPGDEIDQLTLILLDWRPEEAGDDVPRRVAHLAALL